MTEAVRDARRPVLGALRVARWTGRAGAGRLVAAAVGLSLAVAAWVAGAGLAGGAKRELVDRLLRGLPATEVRLQPARRALGAFELGGGHGGLLGGRPLREDRLARLRGLPGVRAVHPRAMSRFPVSVTASALGQSLQTDAVLEGISAEEAAAELGEGAPFAWEEGRDVPVLLPAGLLVLFNEGLAPGAGLPRLSESAAKGVTLTLTLGRSSFARAEGPPWVLPGRVVGVSRRVSAVAAGVPIEVVTAAARRLQPQEEPAFSSAVVVAEDASRIGAVVAEARAVGLEPSADHAFAEQLGRGISFARAALGAVAAALAGLSALALSLAVSSSVRERAPEIALLRALGATRSQVRWMLLAEAAAVGLLGALVGLAAGLGAGFGVASRAGSWLRGSHGIEAGPLFVPSVPSLALVPVAAVGLAVLVTAVAARRGTGDAGG